MDPSYIEELTRKNPTVRSRMETYVSTGDVKVLKGVTFFHIVNYMNKDPYDSNRLSVAMMDFGFTRAHLDDPELSAIELAKKWLEIV